MTASQTANRNVVEFQTVEKFKSFFERFREWKARDAQAALAIQKFLLGLVHTKTIGDRPLEKEAEKFWEFVAATHELVIESNEALSRP